MWTEDRPAETVWNAGQVVPKTIFYYYDGPTVFTAHVGLTEFLFFKFDEGIQSDFFLVSPTNSKVVKGLEQRTLSIRGAVANARDFWILELTRQMDVRRYWKIALEDIGSDWLPDLGVALEPLKAPAADFVEQALSFFSVRFTGENLTESAIPFMRFKTIIDSAYDSLRRIFPAPVVENRSLGRSLDFELFQPKFSSLIIAIDKPVVDLEDAKKYVKSDIDDADFSATFEKHRTDFFDRMGELLGEAEKGEIKKAYAVEHFNTLDQVNPIVPTSSNELDRVEFRSQSPVLIPIVLDDRLGDKFRAAHKIAERASRQVAGVVVDINDSSGTLVIRDENARQITCKFDRSAFDELSVGIGTRIRVRGIFTQRTRRDMIQVTHDPQVLVR